METIKEDLELKRVPKLMKDVVGRGVLGIANQDGIYNDNKAAAVKWEKAWVNFTYAIRKLVEKYDRRVRI